jgi:hypothetical protein
MKTFLFALLAVSSMAFLLTGCSDNSTPVASPAAQSINSPNSSMSLAKGGAIVHSATGAANDFWLGKSQTWAFTARTYADGSCDGEYQIHEHAVPPAEGEIHGKVLSLRIWDYNGGKAAVIGGIETKSGFPGWYDAFVVIDYGEGSKALPDMYTGYIYFAESKEAAIKVWEMSPDQVVQATVDEHNGWSDNKITPADVLIPIGMGNVRVR